MIILISISVRQYFLLGWSVFGFRPRFFLGDFSMLRTKSSSSTPGSSELDPWSKYWFAIRFSSSKTLISYSDSGFSKCFSYLNRWKYCYAIQIRKWTESAAWFSFLSVDLHHLVVGRTFNFCDKANRLHNVQLEEFNDNQIWLDYQAG